MSSTPTDPQFSAIDNINFTGGFPNSSDLAPSIVFLVLYTFTLPLLVWRWIRPQDRTKMLIRPSLFVLCRIGMLVIRAYMSRNSYGQGLLIAELVLVSIGFLFLIEPVVSCWKLQIDSDMRKEDRPVWVRRLAMLLKFATLGSIFTAIAGSALISSALKGDTSLDTVRQLREASNVLSIGVVVITFFAALLTYFHFSLDTRGTIYIVSLCASLFIVAMYRVIQTFTHDPTSPIRTQVAFWVLQMVFEFIAFVLLLSISLPTWFPGHSNLADRVVSSTGSDLEAGQKPFNTAGNY